ncbi:MAG TPA: dihydrofolate synthase [Bacteroidales bacterium]|nr:dihydrofolate synthase [Bacteroidales bacterium]HBZ22423.1 dihydrofolate synthase [Bacteroidales bacterium]
MNYKQTIEFLYSQLPAYHRIGKAAYKNDLQNTIELDRHLGHPHSGYRTIHVAGTNGKGSVSHMIASVLMEAGYKTGLYTSPHLKDFRERIRVNGKMITRSAVTEFIRKNSLFLASLKPSFFEMTVGMAFDYFARTGVDIAVIEVGLGGRLDSTNIIDPILSIITNIGHDHFDLLGDTFEKVAVEKSGIIKPGVPVVISETQKETENVFAGRASATGSEIFYADRNYTCILNDFDWTKGKRNYRITENLSGKSLKGEVGPGGDYQVKNLQAVYQAFSVMETLIPHSDKNLIDGIRKVETNTKFAGRWQIIGRKPLVVCDTGHNREGLEYVMNQVKKVPKSRLHLVIGFVSDKDLSIVLPLFPPDGVYYFTKASVPRALDEKILMAEAANWNLKGKCFPDVGSAVRSARKNASESDMIFIGGSTFVVADAL